MRCLTRVSRVATLGLPACPNAPHTRAAVITQTPLCVDEACRKDNCRQEECERSSSKTSTSKGYGVLESA